MIPEGCGNAEFKILIEGEVSQMNSKKVIMTGIVSIIGCIAILGTGGNAAWNAHAGGFQWGWSGPAAVSAAAPGVAPIALKESERCS
jgi:hypothetical protein